MGTAGSTDFPVGQLTQSIATTYYTPTDYTNKSTVTQQFQHDQRGRSVATTLQVGVPSTWGVTTALPTYKQTQILMLMEVLLAVTNRLLDDWGKRALLAEGIGGVVGGVAAWAGMAAGPAVTAMFNAPNPEIVANGVGLITGGAGGIIGQGISQTVFPSHPKQQSQFKPAPAARKTTAPVPKKSPVTRKVASLEQLVIEHQVCIQTEEGH